MRMTRLSQSDFEQLAANAKILEADAFGPKVMHLENGLFLKLFRRKRWLSSALWRPYSQRFADNAARLQRLGIPTLAVQALHVLDDQRTTAVLYSPLPGESLSHLARQPDFRWDDTFALLADFIGELHRKGVYFRSLHLGNIIQTPAGTLGLIDLSDMRFLRKALPARLVRRNLGHFDRYLKREGLDRDFPAARLHQVLIESAASSAR